MENIVLNHWAVLVCAAANLLIGGLWYSPLLFHKAWVRESGVDPARLESGNPAAIFGTAFILGWIMAYNLAFFLGEPGTTWKFGLGAGFLAGFGWASLIFAVIALFERRSLRYILINGGYITVYFSAMGLILGAWRP
jgi:hypothetical protein